MKRKLGILMVFALLLTVLPAPAATYGANLSDISGHWAEVYINEAVQKGFVQGYPEGNFLPDKAVTRAEFTTMVNKALGNNGTANIAFADVPYGEWYYADVSKAVAATYAGGYEDNTFKPNNAITRQEAAVVISRIIPAYGSSGNLNAFPDRASIADWAYPAFQKVNGKEYMGPYDDGNLHPLDQLTRAQTAKILCDILNNERIASDPSVRSNTTLSNTIYPNGVTISRDLGDGNATIENCVILGNLSVQGGGDRTVTVNNSRVAQAAVEKSSGSVRLHVRGESVIANLTAARTAIIQTSSLTGGLYGSGIEHLTTASSSEITLQGNFPKVTVGGANAKLDLASGTIKSLIVGSGGRMAEINVESGATVETADVNAESHFFGTGTIVEMNVSANNVTYETKPNRVNVRSGFDDPEETDGAFVKFSPSDGATKVSLDADVIMTFRTAITLYDGGTVRDADIEDYISLHKGSANGTEVDFDGKINNAKTVITLEPDKELDTNTKYFVVLKRNAFEDKNGDANEATTISFTTGTTAGDSHVTFDPKKDDTTVLRSKKPEIRFNEAVELVDGKNMTSNNLRAVITFRETDSSGTTVPFTAEMSSNNRIITIEPADPLKEGQKYYLAIAANKFQTRADKEAIGASHVTWTVAASTYTVTFNANRGTGGTGGGTMNTDTVTSGTNYKIKKNTFTRTDGNYIFDSWNTAANGSGTKYADEETINNVRANITLYARWTAVESVNKTALGTAISAANKLLTETDVSADGADVLTTNVWVTEAVYKALDDALKTSTAVSQSSTSTQQQVDSATNSLNNAREAFEKEIKPGTKAPEGPEEPEG